jgi:hypothetical protein
MGDFDANQKAFIRQVAQEVLEAVLPKIIAAHVNSCPWGKKFNKVVYIATGIGLASGGAIGAFLKGLTQ